MFRAPPARRAIALLLVGVVFVLIGAERHRGGGSGAFILVGVVFVLLGLRDRRRLAPDPPA